MSIQGFRVEKDSLGELQVPENALYGAQTQRAVENFPISGLRMPRAFIRALGLIKATAAQVNQQLGLLSEEQTQAIVKASMAVSSGEYDEHFPIDVFQTGSGTSTNMNSNEVISRLASQSSGLGIHPNDHVNMGQSSNDVIPTAIHVSAVLETREQLLPAMEHLAVTLEKRAAELNNIVKTGRTHLMDAMPVTLGQELGAWASQVRQGQARIASALDRVSELAQGGTAVGTGINAHPEFGEKFATQLSTTTGASFKASPNFFVSIGSQDAAVELSGQLKTYAVSMMKIANDLRWMNSGPLTGIAEITLPALQPGSSIMPGKINPVIPEAAAMVAAQVIGNDAAIAVGGQSGNFQLNVMLPMIALNLLQSIELLANTSRVMADKAIAGFTVNESKIKAQVARNPILVTALNAVIGYDKGAAIAKKAYADGRPIKDVASDMTDLTDEQLDELLDPLAITEGGIRK